MELSKDLLPIYIRLCEYFLFLCHLLLPLFLLFTHCPFEIGHFYMLATALSLYGFARLRWVSFHSTHTAQKRVSAIHKYHRRLCSSHASDSSSPFFHFDLVFISFHFTISFLFRLSSSSFIFFCGRLFSLFFSPFFDLDIFILLLLDEYFRCYAKSQPKEKEKNFSVCQPTIPLSVDSVLSRCHRFFFSPMSIRMAKAQAENDERKQTEWKRHETKHQKRKSQNRYEEIKWPNREIHSFNAHQNEEPKKARENRMENFFGVNNRRQDEKKAEKKMEWQRQSNRQTNAHTKYSKMVFVCCLLSAFFGCQWTNTAETTWCWHWPFP